MLALPLALSSIVPRIILHRGTLMQLTNKKILFFFWSENSASFSLGAPAQERHGLVRVGPEMGHENSQRAGAPLL